MNDLISMHYNPRCCHLRPKPSIMIHKVAMNKESPPNLFGIPPMLPKHLLMVTFIHSMRMFNRLCVVKNWHQSGLDGKQNYVRIECCVFAQHLAREKEHVGGGILQGFM